MLQGNTVVQKLIIKSPFAYSAVKDYVWIVDRRRSTQKMIIWVRWCTSIFRMDNSLISVITKLLLFCRCTKMLFSIDGLAIKKLRDLLLIEKNTLKFRTSWSPIIFLILWRRSSIFDYAKHHYYDNNLIVVKVNIYISCI